MEVTFFVHGHAKTAGSKKAFMRPNMRHPVIVDTCNNRDWKNSVAWSAKAAHPHPPLQGPLVLRVRFDMARPKAHFRTGARSHELREDAPTAHTCTPDATKLLRCVEDALNGVLWKDDSQIYHQTVEKIYSDTPGCRITVAN